MNRFLQYFESFQPKPQFAQIAVSGNWEKYVRTELGKAINSDLLSGEIDSSIAGEIFYKLNDGRSIFLGLRYANSLQSVSSPVEFLQKFQETLQTANNKSLSDTLADLGQRLNADTKTYTEFNPDHVELGVVNNWKSVGSMILRKSGEPAITSDSLQALLTQNNQLLNNTKNHIALEFTCNDPHHWIAIQVSTFKNEQYSTDLDMLTELVGML